MTEWLHFHFLLSCTGEGNGNPLQCSCLDNPRDGGAWWAAVYGDAQSRTQLKQLSSSSSRAINTLLLPFTLYPLVSTDLFSISARLLLFWTYIHLYEFSDSIYNWYHTIVVFFDILPSIIFSRSIHVAANGSISSFYRWIIFHSVCVLPLLNPVICWWASGLLPCFAYYKQCCYEHWDSWILFNYSFFSGYIYIYIHHWIIQ